MKLYAKYGMSESEIAYIERKINAMRGENQILACFLLSFWINLNCLLWRFDALTVEVTIIIVKNEAIVGHMVAWDALC